MSPSQLHLNLLAERAKDCTISRAVTGTEITLEAGGRPMVEPDGVPGRRRRRLTGGERDAISPRPKES